MSLFIIFQNLFKSQFLNDKHPVVFMKDMEFENLKSLVEYMYKGEANVPQQMLAAFIKDAESLQIRGLAECANKQFETEQLLTNPRGGPQHSTPISSKKSKHSIAGGQHTAAAVQSAAASALGREGGILAAHLAKMNNQHPMSMFDFSPENFPASLLSRNPALMAGLTPSFPGPPHMKKPRKHPEPRPRGGSPTKEATNGKKPKLASTKPLGKKSVYFLKLFNKE